MVYTSATTWRLAMSSMLAQEIQKQKEGKIKLFLELYTEQILLATLSCPTGPSPKGMAAGF